MGQGKATAEPSHGMLPSLHIGEIQQKKSLPLYVNLLGNLQVFFFNEVPEIKTIYKTLIFCIRVWVPIMEARSSLQVEQVL